MNHRVNPFSWYLSYHSAFRIARTTQKLFALIIATPCSPKNHRLATFRARIVILALLFFDDRFNMFYMINMGSDGRL